MISIINHQWRIFITGISFIFFGIGGLFLSIIIFPVIALTTNDPIIRVQRVQRSISISFRLYVQSTLTLGLGTFEAKGINKLKNDKGTIIIANHPTLVDVVLLGSSLDYFNCIVKESLWHNRFLKGVMKASGYIPNSKSELLIKRCQRCLSQGNKLIIFPEGTRTTPGKKIKLQRGTAQIALRTQAPIRIVHIKCKPITFTKGQKWYHVPKERPHFQLQVGELIDTKNLLDDNIPFSIAARRLTHKLTQILNKDEA